MKEEAGRQNKMGKEERQMKGCDTPDCPAYFYYNG